VQALPTVQMRGTGVRAFDVQGIGRQPTTQLGQLGTLHRPGLASENRLRLYVGF
jgi:hypothetical protein